MKQDHKTFSHAGVSRYKKQMKIRFANDIFRIKVLSTNNHTEIDLIELPYPMTKPDAVEYLLSIDFADGYYEIQETLENAAIKYGVEIPNYHEMAA
jgi:hypothetical protein